MSEISELFYLAADRVNEEGISTEHKKAPNRAPEMKQSLLIMKLSKFDGRCEKLLVSHSCLIVHQVLITTNTHRETPTYRPSTHLGV